MPDWHIVDLIEPSRLETFYGQWLHEGVQLIGACCGHTVEHINAARRARLTKIG